MERLNQIIQMRGYQEQLLAIENYESDRIFCGHDIKHFLDVSRIGYIMVLEAGLPIKKDVIYAIGFLHDIGRGCQYETGEPHHLASVRLSSVLLGESEYTQEEQALILEAIGHHRTQPIDGEVDLNTIMYRADKASRACYDCPAYKECNWSPEKKNSKIEV